MMRRPWVVGVEVPGEGIGKGGMGGQPEWCHWNGGGPLGGVMQ